MSVKKKAVALKYNSEQDMAPVIIASGYGSVAERIINIAEERGIPVYRDDSAASILCMMEVGESIPEELYQIVASIYVQLLETANKIKGGATASIGRPELTLHGGVKDPGAGSLRESAAEAARESLFGSGMGVSAESFIAAREGGARSEPAQE